jgi:hypothetical protein
VSSAASVQRIRKPSSKRWCRWVCVPKSRPNSEISSWGRAFCASHRAGENNSRVSVASSDQCEHYTTVGNGRPGCGAHVAKRIGESQCHHEGVPVTGWFAPSHYRIPDNIRKSGMAVSALWAGCLPFHEPAAQPHKLTNLQARMGEAESHSAHPGVVG